MGVVTVRGRDASGNDRDFSVSDLLDASFGVNLNQAIYRDPVAGWRCVPPTPVIFRWSLAVGTPATVANDIGPWQAAGSNITLTGGSIVAKTAPVGALPGLTYDIKYSRAGGAFVSIFAAGNVALHDSQTYAAFTVSPAFNLLLSDVLRIDCTAVGLSTPGQDVMVQLVGTVTN